MNDHRVYAGLGPRFLAFIIDLILVNLVAGVFFALAWSTIVTAGGDGAVLDRNVLFTWNVRDIGRAAFMALYFAVFTRAFGGTVGKLWLGIHVVTPEGERIGFGTALYRETVGRFLSSIFFLGYLPAIFSEQHVSLHDWLSGTRVVNVRRAAAAPKVSVGEAAHWQGSAEVESASDEAARCGAAADPGEVAQCGAENASDEAARREAEVQEEQRRRTVMDEESLP